jgi:NAD(P)-dependent dehydrogenase (short-subunit alcohol dehydrogenase family)
MSDSNTRTIWLITGANRGIGLGLVRYILNENEKDIVFAGTRDPGKSDDLNKLASEKEGRLFVLELSSESEDQAKAAAQVVRDKFGHVDVVIANAGKLGAGLSYYKHDPMIGPTI